MVIACAAIATSARRPWRFAYASDTTTAAAAPHVGGHAMRRVITPGQITGDWRTCSAVISCRKTARGFLAGVTACLGADFRERLDRRAVGPHVVLPGAAEIPQGEGNLRVPDELVGHAIELVERRRAVVEHHPQRSGSHLLEADRQHAVGGARPTACRARKSAVEPVEQLLFTFTTGTPVMPTR